MIGTPQIIKHVDRMRAVVASRLRSDVYTMSLSNANLSEEIRHFIYKANDVPPRNVGHAKVAPSLLPFATLTSGRTVMILKTRLASSAFALFCFTYTACGASQTETDPNEETSHATDDLSTSDADLGEAGEPDPPSEPLRETDPTPAGGIEVADSPLELPSVVTVTNPGPDAVYATSPAGAAPPPEVSLRVVASVRNEIIDTDRWLAEHPLDRRTDLPIGAPATVMGQPFRYANGLDLAVVQYGEDHDQRYLWAEHEDGPPTIMDLAPLKEQWMSLTYADRRSDVIYLSHSSRSSAAAMNGHNGYITAIDAWTGEVLWRTQPLVANSLSFAILDGVLISGYGFTDEDDFLYAIDIETGRVLAQLPIRKMADHIVYDGETLFVRTYDRDLEVRVRIGRQ